MVPMMTNRKLLFTAVFLGVVAFEQPAFSAFQFTPHINSIGGQQSASIDWPSDSINLSQLQEIFSKLPGISQFNLQFPNQTNWNVTPEAISSLYNNYLQEAQSVGFTGKLPDLSFSSLNINALKSGMATFSIGGMMSNAKMQMDQELRQFRYDELHLGSWMPEWMKRTILALYDSLVQAINFMYDKLMAVL
jgi:hypothetical protein